VQTMITRPTRKPIVVEKGDESCLAFPNDPICIRASASPRSQSMNRKGRGSYVGNCLQKVDYEKVTLNRYRTALGKRGQHTRDRAGLGQYHWGKVAPRIELDIWQLGKHALLGETRSLDDYTGYPSSVDDPVPRNTAILADVGERIVKVLVW